MTGRTLRRTWKTKCSRTVRVPMNKSCCWTYAETAVSSLLLTGTPLMALTPVSVTLRSLLNVSEFNRVVFPAPLDPISAKSSPGRAEPLTEIAIIIDNNRDKSATRYSILCSCFVSRFCGVSTFLRNVTGGKRHG